MASKVKAQPQENIKFELKSARQREVFRAIKEKDVVLICGPSGSGKSLVSIWSGICLLNNAESTIQRIVVVRLAADTCGEDIGALPGNKQEKLLHLAGPVIDNMTQFMSHQQAVGLFEQGIIEILPISHLRGRSFHNTFLIVEEIQNLDDTMVLTVLTRLSAGSKMVLNGDLNQVDIYGRRGVQVAKQLLDGIPQATVVELDATDIYRHPFVRAVVERAAKVFPTPLFLSR
jgi:Phosphate starvation-inducible protein PhoH, predicted ATPase